MASTSPAIEWIRDRGPARTIFDASKLAALMVVLGLGRPLLMAGTLPPAAPSPLTSIAEVKALSSAEAAKGLPVRLEGIVTYYQPAEDMIFLQGETSAIYVRATHRPAVHQGSRVVVTGVTEASYRTRVGSSEVRSIGEATLPAGKPAGFNDLINGIIDCDFVEVSGTVRSSTIQGKNGTLFLLLDLRSKGAPIKVHVADFAGFDPATFLDADISFSAAAGKTYDGKFEPVGVNLFLQKASSIRILSRSAVQPADLPLSGFDKVAASYSPDNQGQRIRVRGAVTLYDPGEMMVLDDQGKTLLIHTRQQDPVSMGQIVDATGFSDYGDYAPSLDYGQFTATAMTAQVPAQFVTYDEAMTGEHAFNVVSLTGVLVAEMHEAFQDTLVIKSGAHVFSAVLRSRLVSLRVPDLPLGSTLRVTGVCLIEAWGPYNKPVNFSLRVRSPQDVAVLRLPSWLNVRRLGLMVGLLLWLIIGSLLWVKLLRKRVATQTALILRTSDEDAAWERRSVYLEKERSVVLEAINSSQPLDSVLELIAAFIGKQIAGVGCSFRLSAAVTGEPRLATVAEAGAEASVRTIRSNDGTQIAEMVLVTDREWHSTAHVEEVLDIGGRLAALAIENRGLHARLVHRSEYDQLTDVPNRFLIEGRLERALDEARESCGKLAVIYVDLDDFKQVNDRYGHRVGDLLLQQTAQRLSAQLRDRDLIARIGGDEFLAIVHDVTGREEAEGVAERLLSCFQHPFSIEDFQITGGASIGIGIFPEDGVNGEELKRSADHAMYSFKRRAKLSRVGVSA